MLTFAKFLLLVTVAYNVVEGGIALWSGFVAGSIALVAFGTDSYIEVAAASLVLWRISISDHDLGEKVEYWVVRFIGWTFLVLCAAIIFQSASALYAREGAEESLVGIILALISVVFMPLIALWKLQIAAKGNLQSIAIEAKETIACSALSLTLLVGLVANATLGWWWLDAVTALLLVPWLLKEGWEGIHGETCHEDLKLCFCGPCLYGLRACPCQTACCEA